jgi:hypothetical protein
MMVTPAESEAPDVRWLPRARSIGCLMVLSILAGHIEAPGRTLSQASAASETSARHLTLLDELTKAEAIWLAEKPQTYQFTFRFACNNDPSTRPPGSGGLWLFQVNGKETQLAGVRPDLADYATVERQFAFIRTAVERRPSRADVRYDPRRGYPTRVCVDPSVASGDGFGFVITAFKILPNAAGAR